MADPDAPGADLKARLLAELKQQLTSELKDELMKELKPSKKGKKAAEPGEALPEVEVKENSAILSSTGKLDLPKHVLKTLGWQKGDVIELAIDGDKMTCQRVGRTTLPARSKAAAPAETDAPGDPVRQAGPAPGLNIGEYFEFEFTERGVAGRVKQVLENAYSLYESGNYADGLKILEMIEKIELKDEEPDRSKMRMGIVKFITSMAVKYPAVTASQVPTAFEMIDKINSRFLKEKAYWVVGNACKRLDDAKDMFDKVLGVLFAALSRYQNTDMYAIVPLLEQVLKLVSGVDTPYTARIKEFMIEKFSQTDDVDYKMRIIRLLTSMDAFAEASALGRQFKETTTEGSSERRAVLDALKENRDKKKAYFEAHPDLQPDVEEEDLEEEVPKKGKKAKGKRDAEAAPVEQGDAEAAPVEEAGEPGGIDEDVPGPDEILTEGDDEPENIDENEEEDAIIDDDGEDE